LKQNRELQGIQAKQNELKELKTSKVKPVCLGLLARANQKRSEVFEEDSSRGNGRVFFVLFLSSFLYFFSLHCSVAFILNCFFFSSSSYSPFT
jgi:hypothetical protein